jgi:hypothetical protein
MIEKPTAAELLTDVMKLVCDPLSSAETRREAVMIAYNLGKCDGRCEGAASMGASMTAAFDKATGKMIDALKSS